VHVVYACFRINVVCEKNMHMFMKVSHILS